MVKNVVLSPSFSFKGWSFIEWAKGNLFIWNWFKSVSKLIKEILKVTASALAGLLIAKYPIYEALIGLVVKLALDSLEYWFKEHIKE